MDIASFVVTGGLVLAVLGVFLADNTAGAVGALILMAFCYVFFFGL